jgi:hypothetical protein
MLDRILGGSGILLLLAGAGGLAFPSTGANHAYTLTVSGDGTASSPLVVSKSGDYVNKFEVDQYFVTTWSVLNSATVDIDVQIGEYATCHIRFDGTTDCRSLKVTVPQGQSRDFMATGDLAFGQYFYQGPSEVRVAVKGGELKKNDPDLEVERDNFFSALLAMLLGAVALVVRWMRRRRPAA